MQYPYLSPSEIDASAHALLRRALKGDALAKPCIDLEALVYGYLCEHESMSFTDEEELGWDGEEQVLGRTWPIAGKIEIARCLKEPGEEGRYRFTLAHEIGHWVLHRPLFLAAAERLDLFEARERIEVLTSLNRGIFPNGGPRPVPPEEWQANRFAVALLFDGETLRSECRRRFGDAPVPLRSRRPPVQARSLRELSRRLARAEVNGHPCLCGVFGVSVEAMAIALETRGYVVEEAPLI